MIRQYFHKFKKSEKDKIAWRSHEPTRIEAFSDTVFGFAISILIISLEVPKSSKELLEMMEGFVPFIFCFATIFSIWYWQYQFFRRYGMHDIATILLNAVLLFMVLFYVYPLKFMFSAWLLSGVNIIRAEDVLMLAVVYNGGLSAIYLVFVLMYVNAYLKKDELILTEEEAFETMSYIYTNIGIMLMGLFVVLLAVIAHKIDVRYTLVSFGGYALMGPVMSILGKRRERLFHKKFGKEPIEEPHLGAE